MNRTDALNMLRRARDGCDPATGEPLPLDHPFQRVDVVRALFVAVDALERSPGRGPRGGPRGGGADDRGAAAGDGTPGDGEGADGDDPASGADGGTPARPRVARPRPANSGQPWSDDDDHRLAEAFDGGADERELAAAFGRSRSSVRARLIRLGRGALLGEGPAPRYPVVRPVDETVAV